MKAIGLIFTCGALLWSNIPETYQAKGWNGFIPLHSTQSEVKHKLGPGQGTCECIYTTPRETIFFGYSESPCKGPIFGWNVPGGTVLKIVVTPKKPKPFRTKDLGPDYVKSHEGVVTTYYTNIQAGIRYAVQKGAIVSTEFIPSRQDEPLRCEGFPSYDGGVTEYHPYDVFGRIPESDTFARLDNFAIEIFNNSKLKGYIIAYAGRTSRPGEANATATKAREYLINRREVARERIIALDGGFREQPELELYLIRASLPAPSSKPKLPLSEVMIVKDP
jgi:hypothetical protein